MGVILNGSQGSLRAARLVEISMSRCVSFKQPIQTPHTDSALILEPAILFEYFLDSEVLFGRLGKFGYLSKVSQPEFLIGAG